MRCPCISRLRSVSLATSYLHAAAAWQSPFAVEKQMCSQSVAGICKHRISEYLQATQLLPQVTCQASCEGVPRCITQHHQLPCMAPVTRLTVYMWLLLTCCSKAGPALPSKARSRLQAQPQAAKPRQARLASVKPSHLRVQAIAGPPTPHTSVQASSTARVQGHRHHHSYLLPLWAGLQLVSVGGACTRRKGLEAVASNAQIGLHGCSHSMKQRPATQHL